MILLLFSVLSFAALTPKTVTFNDLNIAQGLIQGETIVNKFGRNPDIDTASTPEDVWNGGGEYTGFPSSAETVNCVSSSANDTSSGTGARTVRVTGLNENWDITTEVITLNGTSASSNTSNQFLRIHTAQVLTVGSGGVNAGTITCRQSTTTTNIFFVMPVGLNQTYVSAYTVPRGKTAYLKRIFSQIRGNTNARASGGPFRARRPFDVVGSAPLGNDVEGGLIFSEKSDIVIRISSVSANDTEVVYGYDLVLVDN